MISFTMNNYRSNIGIDQPFNVQALTSTHVVSSSKQPIDKLDDSKDEKGIRSILEHPAFPTCFPQNDSATAGGKIQIALEGLSSNSKIHGLFGPLPVFKGQTNSNGSAIIQLPVPSDASQGFHLVTIGVDDTAFTADCVVNVNGKTFSSSMPPFVRSE